MCGRFAIVENKEKIAHRFGATSELAITTRYNVAPGSMVPVVYEKDNMKKLTYMKWGFVPFWSREPSVKFSNINARIETVTKSIAYKKSFIHKRCIVPACGYFEWKKHADGTKQAYFISAAHQSMMGFAGIYDTWTDAEGKVFPSFAILTAPASTSVSAIHDRMPVVLNKHDESGWVHNTSQLDELQKVLGRRVGDFCTYPVSSRVNNPRYDDPDIISEVKIDI